MFAYVGCRTTRERHARGQGISVFQADPDTGGLALVQLLPGQENPSFLALNARGDRLYAVHGDTTRVSAFAIDRASGKLALLNSQDTQGKNPVHLAIDPSGQYLIVCNHIGASLVVLPIAPDGALRPVSQQVPIAGPIGPHRLEQTQAKPHACPFLPGGRHVVVPDKGLDRVFVFGFTGGQLHPAPSEPALAREAAGPRHVAFHPAAPYAYCINELDSTVTVYRCDAAAGALAPLQVLPSLPSTYTGNSRGAEIEVDRNGHYVYASNRGHDSIAAFGIDPASGLLSWAGAWPSGGRTPRYMVLSPNGRFMYALNEDSDSIVAFDVDAATGALSPTGLSVATGSPVCMVFSAPCGAARCCQVSGSRQGA
ncbi:beta-propeller fold lactonase family protein [Bordetella sp. BOR01]|uniref:lactonase family protein n=1 Tax=Bordetella sp. BOR01 TaxID=2854779 RepID=UPI001C47A598|nr:beta-propeller fold lactonase family protein [Bordetella sp. BOR01]MBV7485384.1 lactonase family protein [Bordetella sp. BOR01]